MKKKQKSRYSGLQYGDHIFMLYKMKVSAEAFEYIKSGSKTIEIRLNDGKRQLIKMGDAVEFHKLPDLKEKALVTVLAKEKFSNFDSLVNSYPLQKFGDRRFNKKEDLLNSLREIYSKEEEKKYGVVAIHMKLL